MTTIIVDEANARLQTVNRTLTELEDQFGGLGKDSPFYRLATIMHTELEVLQATLILITKLAKEIGDIRDEMP